MTQVGIRAIINQPYCAPASQPSNAWARKALNIVVGVEHKVHQASEMLPFPHQCTLNNATLQWLLDSAVEMIESTKVSCSCET